MIDAKEGRNILTADIPNAFIQMEMPPPGEGEDRVVMKIKGPLAQLLVGLDPETYAKFITNERGQDVLYVLVLKALYGMLMAALLWYNQLKSDLISIGFKFNPYDPCVANRNVGGKQQTACFHVDDLKSSTIETPIHDEFAQWLEQKYGSVSPVKVHRGTRIPRHDIRLLQGRKSHCRYA